MIQFNLLPAVKLEYIKAKRNKRTTILVAGGVTIVSVVLTVLLFVGVQVFQKKYSRDLSNDIKSQSQTLEGVDDLNKILTIQNQLNSLTAMHDQKPVTTRLFGYLKQLTPAKVSIASISFDFEAHTVNITGSADAISTVNKYVDTLKFTTYKTQDGATAQAFTQVVLAGFGKDDKGASYQLNFTFDPLIFASTEDITLNVPVQVTSRSETEKPDALFQPLSNTEKR